MGSAFEDMLTEVCSRKKSIGLKEREEREKKAKEERERKMADREVCVSRLKADWL